MMRSISINGNLKSLVTIVTVIILLAGLIGNIYFSGYRQDKFETNIEKIETRVQYLEIQVSQINIKLDILIENAKLTEQYKNYRNLRGSR